MRSKMFVCAFMMVFIFLVALTACAASQEVQHSDITAISPDEQIGDFPDVENSGGLESIEKQGIPVIELDNVLTPMTENIDANLDVENDDISDADSQTSVTVTPEPESEFNQKIEETEEVSKNEANAEETEAAESKPKEESAEVSPVENVENEQHDISNPSNYAYIGLDGDFHDSGFVTDTDDPHAGMPGYEGPKEGYEWNVVLGYYKKDEVVADFNKVMEEAEEKGVNYYDFQGHLMAYRENGEQDGYDYLEWIQNNMDYVNAYCERNGITYEQYLEANHVA